VPASSVASACGSTPANVRRAPQQRPARGQQLQFGKPTVPAAAFELQQSAVDQQPYEVAGRELMDVHCPRQIVHAEHRARAHDAHRPQLRPADAGARLDAREMRLDHLEYHAKLPQHARRRLGLGGLAGRGAGGRRAGAFGDPLHARIIERASARAARGPDLRQRQRQRQEMGNKCGAPKGP
jgi:hypothetical protein